MAKTQIIRPFWSIIAYFTILTVAIGLAITSFFLPPTGQIDPSVLQTIAMFLGFYLVYDLPYTLVTLKSFRLTKGDITIEGETKEKEHV